MYGANGRGEVPGGWCVYASGANTRASPKSVTAAHIWVGGSRVASACADPGVVPDWSSSLSKIF